MIYTELRNEADKLWQLACIKRWGRKCTVCNKPFSEIHHFFSRRSHAHLRYDLENAVPICLDCHTKHHHMGDKTIHQSIIRRRGDVWYNELKQKSLERKYSFINANWYQQNIEILQNYLNS